MKTHIQFPFPLVFNLSSLVPNSVLLFFMLWLTSLTSTLAQDVQWQKNLGGSKTDSATAILATADGGYIVVGSTASTDGDVENNHGGAHDIFVVKLTSTGSIIWKKTFGGSGDDIARGITASTDGGYVLTGVTTSTDDDMKGLFQYSNFPFYYIWAFKLNSSGEIVWKQGKGESRGLYATSITTVKDGGFLIAGYLYFQGIKTANFFYVLKLSNAGEIQWVHHFGGDHGDDLLYALTATDDGGCVVVGKTSSPTLQTETVTGNSDHTTNHNTYDSYDAWVSKLNSQGYVVWYKFFGGSGLDYANSINSTPDGGYLVGGYTQSTNGDVSSNHGGGDAWVLKLTGTGEIIWQKTLGGNNSDNVNALTIMGDGNYLVAGTTNSYNGDVNGNHGASDIWLAGLNNNGNLIWQKALGGSGMDETRAIIPNKDGGFAIAGTSDSADGDVIGNQGSSDIWVVKLESPPSPQALMLLAPTYNCQSGAIRFNTSGGDGSAVTFSAPGITRANPTDNFGVVEVELRNDPKTIPITAYQNGYSVTYPFDLKAVCTSTNPTPKPPVLLQPIPDQHFVLNQPLPGSGFAVGLYFADPTPYIPNYSSGWNFQVNGLPPGLYVFAKPMIGSGSPVQVIQGVPNLVGVYTVAINASTAAFPDQPVITTFKIIVTSSNPATTLSLTQPTYDCQSGAITFNTSGGDGSPITFTAPGIARSTPTSNTGIVEAELRADPKPILIQAEQRGQRSTYLFDFQLFCATTNPPVSPLILVAPTYNCSTGAIHFNTRGGDGSPIEFRAVPGITDWTINPDQFVDKESRTAGDVQPFTLQARQGGVTTTYSWDLKATCGRARLGAQEASTDLILSVLGNPIQENLSVLIQGADNQYLQLRLSDLKGQLIEIRHIEQAGVEEVQNFHVTKAPSGVLILQAITATQLKSVKIIQN
ncbi:hypothetical protein G8759_22230 [Spirosoma aureum]|uniref:T9SS type A sorting domain-containing protein n=1 Tax=Spirosoma aureum TaxID=2692134 RepID=A0A6G9AS37_9BACT|nr:hypothetical protein [Spirosoma aureum]QIP15146.1 hypothetical protein G8759_22230 [Spirosoma aureum]